MASMDNPSVSVEVKRRLYATKMFNLSNFLRELTRYGESLDICQKAIAYQKSIKRTQMLGQLYYNQAVAQASLGDIKKATESYELSCSQFERDGEVENAERVRT